MVADPLRCDPRWLFYALLNDRPRIVSLATGAAQQNLSGKAIRDFVYPTPLLPEQRAIGEVLGALDDKIAANTRRWRSGLDLLRSLYADAARVAARASALGELYDVGLSGVWGAGEPSDATPVATSCLRGRDLETYVAGAIPGAPIRYVTARQLAPRAVGEGEIWTAGSGTLGPTLLMTADVAGAWPRRVTYSNFVKRLVPKPNHTRFAEAWLAIELAFRRGAGSSVGTGTSIPNLDAAALLREVTVPELEPARSAELNALSVHLLHPAPLRENLTLAATRDALLPALMSGALRVRDAERVVETLT